MEEKLKDGGEADAETRMSIRRINARQFVDESTDWMLDTRSRFFIRFMSSGRELEIPKEGGRDNDNRPAMIIFVGQARWKGSPSQDGAATLAEKRYVNRFLGEINSLRYDNYIIQN